MDAHSLAHDIHKTCPQDFQSTVHVPNPLITVTMMLTRHTKFELLQPVWETYNILIYG